MAVAGTPPAAPGGGSGTERGDGWDYGGVCGALPPWIANGPPTCPLVLNFGPGPMTFLGRAVPFDFYGDGGAPLADWIGPQSGLLVLPDASGNVTTGAQLFGTATALPNGSLAADGFSALAQYDANGDGVISASDPVFPRLALWFDANGNGVSDPGEVVPLASREVTAWVLADRTVDIDRDATGSYVGLNSTFTVSGGGSVASGELADAYFAIR